MTAPQQDGEPSGGGEPANENESMELNQNPNVPSEVTLRLWNDVAQGIDKNSTGEEGERQSINTYSLLLARGTCRTILLLAGHRIQ